MLCTGTLKMPYIIHFPGITYSKVVELFSKKKKICPIYCGFINFCGFQGDQRNQMFIKAKYLIAGFMKMDH